jgi:hypothetical protein
MEAGSAPAEPTGVSPMTADGSSDRGLPVMSPPGSGSSTVAHPFAGGPLAAAPPTQPVQQIWRKGRRLVTVNNTRLDGRCVKCNAPIGDQRMKRTFQWHHPALYLTILAGLLIYVIIALVMRKKATVFIGVCSRHRRRRMIHITVSWLIVLASFGLGALAIVMERAEIALLGLLVFFFGLVYAVLLVPILTPARIDDYSVWLKGCCEEYLAQYPEWPRR